MCQRIVQTAFRVDMPEWLKSKVSSHNRHIIEGSMGNSVLHVGISSPLITTKLVELRIGPTKNNILRNQFMMYVAKASHLLGAPVLQKRPLLKALHGERKLQALYDAWDMYDLLSIQDRFLVGR